VPGFDDEERWERRFVRLSDVLPYLLLTVSTVLAVSQPAQAWSDRLVMLGLSAIAGTWVRFGFRSAELAEQRSITMRLVYFFGLLVLEAILVTRSPFYIAFTVTGFVQAFLALPGVAAFVVALLSSIVIYTVPGGLPAPTFPAVSIYVFLVLLQTFGTGGFAYLSSKLADARQRRKQLMVDLETALAENAGLHAQLLVQAREAGMLDERQRMAGEIHDTIAQGLAGIVTQLEAADHSVQRPDQLRDHLASARKLARNSLAEARRSVRSLAPEPLGDARLPDAVRELADDWSTTSGVPVTVTVTGDARPLLPDLEVTLFRVAGEALVNVAKHAGAGRVGLTLSYMEDVVVLDVRDDGTGFPAADVVSGGYDGSGHGYGLTSMRRRLQRVAGSLGIESAPGDGTTVTGTVPAILITDNTREDEG
jgi:signal transduction histidine kinase